MFCSLVLAAALVGEKYLMPSEDPEHNPDKDDHAPRYGAPAGGKGQRGFRPGEGPQAATVRRPPVYWGEGYYYYPYWGWRYYRR